MPFTAEQRLAIQIAIANAQKNNFKKEEIAISDSELPNNSEDNYVLSNNLGNPYLVELYQTPVLTPKSGGTSVISEPDLGEPIIVNSDNLLEDKPDKKDLEVKDIDISIPTSEDENGNVINEDNSKNNIIPKKPNYIFIGLAGVVGILIIYNFFFNKKTE